ncbi:MAG: hypothetical protein Faunusvirus3_33 [Faunusvirus sp.]|jgi:hypothetical protein|uniref:Uncharacterized protein n=1 Tax=Faunusvirus sp. TaxID=2487766 RepID=A0A3G5A002_9VIRU|nr:MAG: hypothetical protein Faunusvirus3_33 [Faunusvirus sp.]
MNSEKQKYIKDEIKKIQQAMETDDIKKTWLEYLACDDVDKKRQLKGEYFIKLEKEFPDFSKNYLYLFRMVISRSNLANLDMMLNMLTKIKNGIVAADVGCLDVNKQLDEQYLPDSVKKTIPASAYKPKYRKGKLAN